MLVAQTPGPGSSSGLGARLSCKDLLWSLVETWEKKLLVVGRRKGNVLFNDTLNTFYLRLNGVSGREKMKSP